MMGGILELSSTGTERRGTSDDRPLSASYISALHIPLTGGLLSLTASGNDSIIQNTDPAGELKMLAAGGGGVVVDTDGDLSPDSPGARWCGQDSYEWLGMATGLLRLKPGGSPSSSGDLVASDSGLSIDLYMYDAYAGGTKKIIDELAALGGDLSGTVLNATVDQVYLASSEYWPDKNSRIVFAFSEIDSTLYINLKDSSGNTYYTTILMSSP